MRIAILGAGRMGTWLIDQLTPSHEVLVFDPAGTVAAPKAAPARALAEFGPWRPEMVINAGPLDQVVEIFKSISPYIPEAALWCDIASVKDEVAEYYKEEKRRFVSIHPNFGPAAFPPELLKDENAIIISESDQQGKEFFRRFFHERGVRVVELAFDDFDPMMAYSLCVPGAASLVFGCCVDKKAVPSTSFNKHLAILTYLLSQDDHFLAEVMFNPHCLAQLDKMTAKLEFVKHIIRSRDLGEMQKLLSFLRRRVLEKG